MRGLAGVVRAIVFTVGLVCFLSGARGGPFEDGLEAYKRADYATALEIFRLFAEQGNALAQHNLGAMYANGQGVQQDYAEALKWHRLAAENGNAEAQSSIGACTSTVEGSHKITQKQSSRTD